jgi:hypothetical protein
MTNVLGIVIVTPEKKMYEKNAERRKRRGTHISNKHNIKETEDGVGRQYEIHS